jgi:hypothetical protein
MQSKEAQIQEWDDMLPQWAIRKAMPGILEVGCHLPTRDGRVMGNAHIVEITAGLMGRGRPYYTVVTDAGTTVVMNSTEINDTFWPPRYISGVGEVRRKVNLDGEFDLPA